jgi:hypothetical protein
MSLFRVNKPKVTLLFKEILGEIIDAQPDLPLGVAIELAAEQAKLPCPNLEAMALRLMEDAAPPPAEAPTHPGPKGNGYGANWSAWLNGLKTDQLCLWLADYDPQRAQVLYCEIEMDLVKAMIELKTANVWQDLRTRFEACLLGFGGKLSSQDTTVHDIDMTDKQSVDSMIDIMKKLGF